MTRRFDILGDLGGTGLWGPGVDPELRELVAPSAREGSWRVTFGSEVIADLAAGLKDHRTLVGRRFPRKAEPIPVVIGSTCWLTSDEVVDALLAPTDDGIPFATHCCILINKTRLHPAAVRLATQGTPVPKELLPGLTSYLPRSDDGRTPIIGPGSPLDDPALGPLRVVGWRREGSRAVPLLHAKVAVCAAIYTWETDVGPTMDSLEPMSVWMGSANWTAASAHHLEVGAWCADRALAKAVLDWLSRVVVISEPADSQSEDPSPELVLADWDDAAFAELARDLDLDQDAEYTESPDFE